MTTLAMRSSATCTLCGCRIRGIMVGGGRVNKTSLKFDGPMLAFRDRACPECGWETDSVPSVWRLDAESQAKVDSSRAKRGWS